MRRLRFSLAWLIFPSIWIAESTRASISAKGILTNIVCISSCRPFKNLSFFLASVSISSGAYLANDKNLSRYSTTVIRPCFSSLNSSLILDQTRWHMGSAELDLEFLQGHHLSSGH